MQRRQHPAERDLEQRVEDIGVGVVTLKALERPLHGRQRRDAAPAFVEDLRFFSHHVEILGVYPADRFRERIG